MTDKQTKRTDSHLMACQEITAVSGQALTVRTDQHIQQKADDAEYQCRDE